MQHATYADQHHGRVGVRRALIVTLLVGALMAALLPASTTPAAFAQSAGLPDILVEAVDVPTAGDAAEVVVVHGIPGVVVDVLVDGEAAIEDFRYGDTAVAELPAGTYDLAVAAAGTTTPILELENVPVENGVSYSVVAHLDADGAPTLSPFANETDVEGIQAFHVADFADVVLLSGTTVVVDNVANGDDFKADVPGGGTVEDVGIGLAGTTVAAIELGDVTVPADTLLLVYAVGPGLDFSDVAAGNVHRDNILRLANAGIILGFEDGTFRPFLNVTRGQLSSILARTAGLEPAAPPYTFTDIAGSVHAGNIQALADAGIIAGFSDGTFRPSAPVTRAQAASLIGRWIDVDEVATGPFTDVAPGGVHSGYINALNQLGIILGRTPTTFEPGSPLQRAQTASIVARTLDVLADADLVLTVLHINDGESALLPDEGAGFPGAARFAADLLERQQLATGGGVMAAADAHDGPTRAAVTISAGDNYLAGPRLNASLDNPDEFYDALIYTHTGFDAIAVGNHEFDFGPDVFADFIEATDDIPFVSANLDVSGEPRLQALADAGRLAASTVVSRGDYEIGIVGATYEGLESISSPRNATTGPVLEAVQDEVDRLTDEGVGIIIMASHLQDLDTELSLVPQLSNVDAVVGGGGGEALGDDYPLLATDADGRTVPVVTVPGNYTDIGQLVLEINALGDVVGIGTDSALIPVPLDGPRDAFIDENVEEPVAAYVASLADAEIGDSEVPLDGRRQGPGVRDRETNLGSLLADAMLYSARERAPDFGLPEADVALQNGGGIRNDGVIPAGPVTLLDTFNVAAFANVVSVSEIDGDTLRSALERSVTALPAPAGSHGQWGGIRFNYDTTQPAQVIEGGVVVTEGERIVDAVVTRADGTEVQLVDDGVTVAGDETFVMASIDFLLSGQDGYVMFEAADLTRVGVTYQQSLSEYISFLGTVTADDYPDVSVDNDTFTRFGPVGEFTVEPPVDPDAPDFTAVVEAGTLAIGATEFAFPGCPDGVAADPEVGCIEFSGFIDFVEGTHTVPAANVSFPPVFLEGTAIGDVEVQITAPDGFTGDIDPGTGALTFEGLLEIRVPLVGAGCGFDLDIEATTGTSGAADGEALTIVGDIATGTVVDGLFEVPVTSGCGGLGGTVDGLLGLPSASGENLISLDVRFVLNL
jgi:2',3'-cyclic-nucleotide 2'-phosphodiesterase (5'-nucleotidase family)